jgi:hypothetical protein
MDGAVIFSNPAFVLEKQVQPLEDLSPQLVAGRDGEVQRPCHLTCLTVSPELAYRIISL